MDMKTRYVVKGIGKEQTISSVINIYLNSQGKIEKVEDKWDGKLPDSAIANVSFPQLMSPWWWLYYMEAWIFWLWSFVWYTRIWLVRGIDLFSLAVPINESKVVADHPFTGLPPSERRDGAQDYQCAKGQGRRC